MLRQVWFYSRYDVEVHAIELERPVAGPAAEATYSFFPACSPRLFLLVHRHGLTAPGDGFSSFS
jgi:hypothetical protein